MTLLQSIADFKLHSLSVIKRHDSQSWRFQEGHCFIASWHAYAFYLLNEISSARPSQEAWSRRLWWNIWCLSSPIKKAKRELQHYRADIGAMRIFSSCRHYCASSSPARGNYLRNRAIMHCFKLTQFLCYHQRSLFSLYCSRNLIYNSEV